MFTIGKNEKLSIDIIERAIEYNEEKRKRYDKLEKYYKGKHDILDRIKPPTAKNTRVVVNHASYIVDTAVGYLFGNPVTYKTEEEFSTDYLEEQYKKQTISDLDHEIAKNVAIFGKQYELVYNSDNEVKSATIDVRNCVLIYDDTVEHNKLYGIIYKVREEDIDKKEKRFEDLVVYDETHEYGYNTAGKVLSQGKGKPHKFGQVPIIEYRNNPEEMGDFEDVISLIDAYNILQSDRINDKEQLVEAILVGYNVNLEKEQMEELQINRTMFGLPEDSKVEYLIKTLDETQIDVLRKTLERDIHKIAKVPNMTDDNFAGNTSGVAIRYKLLAFEINTKNKERHFEKGLLERFKVYNNYLSAINKMPEVPVYKVDVIFKRNMPQNELELSQMITNLTGIVDRETLVGILPFIDDAEEVVNKSKQEKTEILTKESPDFGTAKPTRNQKTNEVEQEEQEE